ncbi:MAG: SPOR domain-containing protein [Bdellovibrionota bacterium]
MGLKHRLFIYDGKEIRLLVLIGVVVVIFAFTFGVHFAKNSATQAVSLPSSEVGAKKPLNNAEGIAQVVDKQVPPEQELNEQARYANQVADEILERSTRDEVSKIGLKLDVSRQVDLPKDTRSQKLAKKMTKQDPASDIENSASRQGRYFSLQIGSYLSEEEARQQVFELKESIGLKASYSEVDIGENKKRYRVFAGNFSSRELAERAGQSYKATGIIDTFLIITKIGGDND